MSEARRPRRAAPRPVGRTRWVIGAVAVVAVGSVLAGARVVGANLAGGSDAMRRVAPTDPASTATKACPSGGEVASTAADLVRSAVEFRLTLDVPDAPRATADLSPADRAALVSRGTARALQLFSGAEVTRELDDVRRVGAATGSDGAVDQPLAGGVSAFACTGATVTPGGVRIEARATTWARVATVANGVLTYAQPTGDTLVRATVVQPSAREPMTVASLTYGFAEGSGP